jgi:hypothetical protein
MTYATHFFAIGFIVGIVSFMAAVVVLKAVQAWADWKLDQINKVKATT